MNNKINSKIFLVVIGPPPKEGAHHVDSLETESDYSRFSPPSEGGGHIPPRSAPPKEGPCAGGGGQSTISSPARPAISLRQHREKEEKMNPFLL